MNDFEQFLKRQVLRKVPASWRDEVLAAAGAKRVNETTEQTPGWLAWLWPSPVAWGALACAWVLIIGLDAASRPSPGEAAAGVSLSSKDVATVIAERRQLVQEFFQAEASAPTAPRRTGVPGACNGRCVPAQAPTA